MKDYIESDMFDKKLHERVQTRINGSKLYIKSGNRWKRVDYNKLDLLNINTAKSRGFLRKKGDKEGDISVARRLLIDIEDELKYFINLRYEFTVVLDDLKNKGYMVSFKVYKNGEPREEKGIDCQFWFFFNGNDGFKVKRRGSVPYRVRPNYRLQKNIWDAINRGIDLFKKREIKEELIIKFEEMRKQFYKEDIIYSNRDKVGVKRIDATTGIENVWELTFDKKTMSSKSTVGFEEYISAAFEVKDTFGIENYWINDMVLSRTTSDFFG